MADYYVDPLGGKDSNAGTDKNAPLATYTEALSKAGSGTDVIHLMRGTYFGGSYSFTSVPSGITTVGYGAVMNCTGHSYFITNVTNNKYYYFKGLTIAGFSSSLENQTVYPGSYISYVNCMMYQKGALKDTTYLRTGESRLTALYNCFWWGIGMAKVGGGSFGEYSVFRNSVIVTHDENIYLNHRYASNNASNISILRGTGGFDTSTFPIPVYSDDSDSPDLRYDTSHPQYTKYSVGGERGDIVGTPSGIVVSYSQHLSKFSLDSDVANGPWVNDDSYYDPSFAALAVSAAENNNKIDFAEDGGELTGTLADDTYATRDLLMTAVETAMNGVAAATITGDVSAANHGTLATDGTEFSLLSLTGTNFANSIYGDIGFDVTTDHTGQTLYTAEDPLTIGPGGGAPSDAAPVTIASYKISLNLDTEPSGKSGRAASTVIDLFRPEKLTRIYVAKVIEGLGEVDNSAGDAIREIEVRAQNEPFAWDDAGGTTTLDWTLVQYAGLEDLDETYRYWQIRIIVRIDKVS